MSSMEAPLRLKLRIAMDRAAAAGDWERAGQLEQQWMDVVMGRTTLDSLEARLARLDARRVKQAPGQLGLALSGGPGTGQPCGRGHIAADLTCHKGAGEAAPLDSSKPFTDEQLKEIGDGIRQRFVTNSLSRQSADDVIEAMSRMAQAPGIIGENARKALAFIHEEQPLIHAVPSLSDYNFDGEALLQLRKGKRVGLFTEERLAILEQDPSPRGKAMADRLRRVLALKPEDFEVDEQKVAALEGVIYELDGKRIRGEISPSDWSESTRPVKEALNKAKYGPMYAKSDVGQAVAEALVSANAGGTFKPGSSQYFVRSMPAAAGSSLNPAKINPALISSTMGNSLDALEGAKEYHTRYNTGLDWRMHVPYVVGSAAGLEPSATALSVHYHELGHLIHYTATQYAFDRPVQDQPIVDTHRIYPTTTDRAKAPSAVARRMRQKEGPTRYSNTNAQEMFAEGFALYVMSPGALQRHFPDLYEWVDATVEKARGNARSLKGLPTSPR